MTTPICDYCETEQGISRMNGEYFICDDCNDDNLLFAKCAGCGCEDTCTELMHEGTTGKFYCDDECFRKANGENPQEEECEWYDADETAWRVIKINKKERESARETA